MPCMLCIMQQLPDRLPLRQRFHDCDGSQTAASLCSHLLWSCQTLCELHCSKQPLVLSVAKQAMPAVICWASTDSLPLEG